MSQIEVEEFTAESMYWGGFFDGEGSIGIYLSNKKRKHPTHKVCLTISNSCQSIMNAFVRFAGFGKITPRKIKGHKTAYYWTVRGRRAVIFLERMLPNLFIKQDEAEAAVAAEKTLHNTALRSAAPRAITPHLHGVA